MSATDARVAHENGKQAIRLEDLLEEIHLVREDERRRLSIEIHDGVAQWMIGALYRIKACRGLLSQSNPGELRDELSGVERTIRRSVRELRRVIADLRPLPLEELGLVAAIRQIAAALEEEGITCRFEVVGVLPRLTPAEERATFGIAREALTNIRKHAQAKRVSLRLRFHDHTVSLQVRDNGIGFDPKSIAITQVRPTHIGLLGMKDTAAVIGAYLKIDSSPGNGTSVRLTFPATSGQTAPTAEER